MPLFSRARREPSVISRADRAREALQWDIAADFYRKALDRNPDNPPIWGRARTWSPIASSAAAGWKLLPQRRGPL
jgi:hypothetical protein